TGFLQALSAPAAAPRNAVRLARYFADGRRSQTTGVRQARAGPRRRGSASAQLDIRRSRPFHLLFHFAAFKLFHVEHDALRLRHPSSPRVALVLSAVLVLCAPVLEAGAPIAGISNRLGEQRRGIRLLDINGMGEPRGDARVSQ